jgi:hypothetical protein
MRISLPILLQVPGTLVILAFVPTNAGKLFALIAFWGLTFRRLSKSETLLALFAGIFFTGMNIASLRQGIFSFSDPDLVGLPIYETVMWSFYLLHTKRMLAGSLPQDGVFVPLVLAVLYSVAFAAISDPGLLLAVTGALLIVGLIVFHEPMDLAFTGYMIFLGALIEYTGVLSGLWYYPGAPLGGVPLWFVTLWGGVGLFLRRLFLPAVARYERPLQRESNDCRT